MNNIHPTITSALAPVLNVLAPALTEGDQETSVEGVYKRRCRACAGWFVPDNDEHVCMDCALHKPRGCGMKAWELLDSPEKWCQNALALDAGGHIVLDCQSPRAVRWCAVGALLRCYGDRTTEYGAARLKLYDIIGEEIISSWNNAPARTFEEVRNALIAADV